MPAPVVTFEAGHFRGMRLKSDLRDWDHKYVFRAMNMVPNGGVYGPRPGDSNWTVDGFVSRVVQQEHVIRFVNGSMQDIIIAGGELYKRDSVGSFTKVITAANLAAASITLNSTGRVWCVTFDNQLIVTDGTNTPFAWNGTSGGGLTKLTNAPVAYGPPTVYYAKLFFVKNTERSTIVWSEENDPNTGYEAGGFNNAWELGQTSQAGPLERILGLNDGLYYWRRLSIGVIRGAVNDDFTGSGVHDSISGQQGTIAPGSVIYYNDWVWFVDVYGRPWRFLPGGSPEPLWQQMDALFAGIDYPGSGNAIQLTPTDVALTLAASFPYVDGVVMAYTPHNDAYYSRLFLFRATDGQLLSELSFSITNAPGLDFVGNGAGDSFEDIATLSVSAALSGGFNATSNQTCPRSAQSASFFSMSGTSWVVPGPFGVDDSLLYHWDQLDLFLDLQVNTPATITVQCNATEDLNFEDDIVLNGLVVSASATQHRRARVAVGLAREMRYLMAKVSAQGGLVGFAGIRLRALAQPLYAEKT